MHGCRFSLFAAATDVDDVVIKVMFPKGETPAVTYIVQPLVRRDVPTSDIARDATAAPSCLRIQEFLAVLQQHGLPTQDIKYTTGGETFLFEFATCDETPIRVHVIVKPRLGYSCPPTYEGMNAVWRIDHTGAPLYSSDEVFKHVAAAREAGQKDTTSLVERVYRSIDLTDEATE